MDASNVAQHSAPKEHTNLAETVAADGQQQKTAVQRGHRELSRIARVYAMVALAFYVTLRTLQSNQPETASLVGYGLGSAAIAALVLGLLGAWAGPQKWASFSLPRRLAIFFAPMVMLMRALA